MHECPRNRTSWSLCFKQVGARSQTHQKPWLPNFNVIPAEPNICASLRTRARLVQTSKRLNDCVSRSIEITVEQSNLLSQIDDGLKAPKCSQRRLKDLSQLIWLCDQIVSYISHKEQYTLSNIPPPPNSYSLFACSVMVVKWKICHGMNQCCEYCSVKVQLLNIHRILSKRSVG